MLHYLNKQATPQNLSILTTVPAFTSTSLSSWQVNPHYLHESGMTNPSTSDIAQYLV